jgi:hypothetical protein
LSHSTCTHIFLLDPTTSPALAHKVPVQSNLRWGADRQTADRICNFNRHYAEHSGYFEQTDLVKDAKGQSEISFYDSNTGDLLFTAPKGRTMEEFLVESRAHGWPSFRGTILLFCLSPHLLFQTSRLMRFNVLNADAEVNWEKVRILPDGEIVSLAGTHLGHNLVRQYDL